ncbi:amidophosphoribosyltransferase [Treponema pedis]|uniref:amidophosphoribosyltransferase n=1 Tax=Treponema pedis TaxID=409322 RepID=UPI0004007F95|nr:amidophosphoribosyltransferase [Treponema pedis]
MNREGNFFKSSLNEECGIAAVWDSKSCGTKTPERLDDAARSVFYALFSLQHRGQEAAGIAVSNGKHIRIFKKPGLVSNIFTENDIANLQGYAAIGHTRYSTTGSSSAGNIQPFYIETMHGPIALSHNGNLVNAPLLRRKLLERGVGLSSTSDTEVMIMMLAAASGNSWAERIASCMKEWEGAFSIAVLTTEGIYIARDPWGFRPLCVGCIQNGISAAASESCAMLTLGCDNVFEVKAGEILKLTDTGADLCGKIPEKNISPCIFEYVYFARPDSIWNNASVHTARVNFGKELAKTAPVVADIVIAIPDSSRSAAIGYSQESGIPYDEGFSKNRYIGRTFIQPTQKLRNQGVAMKFNILEQAVNGKKIVVVDDSIVRGSTIGPLIKMLRKAGAKEVHIRISAPPVRYSCFMGVDMGAPENLIAHNKSAEEIRVHIGADSLAFLSQEKMLIAMKNSGAETAFCCACFDGKYPLDVSKAASKEGFE